MKAMASPGDEAATPTASVPSGRGLESWNRLTGSGTDRQDDPGRRRGGHEVVPAVRVARQAPALVQPPVTGREEHVVHARRGVAGQLQHRLAPLVAELPADRRSGRPRDVPVSLS